MFFYYEKQNKAVSLNSLQLECRIILHLFDEIMKGTERSFSKK